MSDTGSHHTSTPLQAMSEEQLNSFLEKVKADTSLQEKLKAAKDVDAVVAIAKAAGYAISVDELKNNLPLLRIIWLPLKESLNIGFCSRLKYFFLDCSNGII